MEQFDDPHARVDVPSGFRGRQVTIGVLLALLLGAGAVACSSDSSDEASDSTPVTAAADAGDATTDDAADDEGDSGDGASEEALTSEDICGMLTAEAVAEASGLTVTEAVPSESSTPQCAYQYTSENGPDSNLTVAASRYTSSDAQSIEQAFDGAVEINISTAGGTDVETIDIDAGDEAVILSGVALDLGVLRVGNVLASLIVPPDAITPDQAESLMVVIGNAFA